MSTATLEKNILTDEKTQNIQSHFGSSIIKIEKDRTGCVVVWAKKEDIVDLLGFLKRTQGLEFEFLSDLTAYDEKGSHEESQSRFVVVYNLFSPTFKFRIRIKVRLQEGEDCFSVISVWKSANWAEREVFDMFGIRFIGHPDLRRILMDARWEGHPLRKDYPLRKTQLFDQPEEIPMHLLEEGLPESAKQKQIKGI